MDDKEHDGQPEPASVAAEEQIGVEQNRHSSSGSDEMAAEKAGQVQQQPAQPSPQGQDGSKKPSRIKQIWDKLGLDAMTLIIMFKGSIPPTVAIAMYQATSVAGVYQTIGYLVAIASVLGFSIMPRGKFFQHITLCVFAVCLGAAINLLALYCATQARLHTTPANQPPTQGLDYNSSASAVCAIWLMVQIYVVSALRAARPQFQLPGIIYSIFIIVSLTYGVAFPNMAAAISFMTRLLEAFLTGFALATANHFLIFPTSSRMVVFKEMTGYLQLLSGVTKLQTAYMASLENFDPFKPKETDGEDGKEKAKKKPVDVAFPQPSDEIWTTPASVKMRELMGKLTELHTKLHGDLTPAKREIALGKLESHDLTELWKLSRSIFLPVLGLVSMANILERQVELAGWKEGEELTPEALKHRQDLVALVQQSMKFLHKPFAEMTETLGAGFQHVLIVLELVKPPKQKEADEESKGDVPPAPGSLGFAESYKQKVDTFYNSKKRSLEDFCVEQGIQLPPDFWESSFIHPPTLSLDQEHERERRQRQLFFVLYLEYLLWRVAKALLDMILYVDKRKQQCVFKRSKIIFPGSKTIYKWLRDVFGKEDLSQEDSYTADYDAGVSDSMYLGETFPQNRDPEHLPPRNAWEKFGDHVRSIPKFLRSTESAFGFRVVAAVMTLGVVCFLEATQAFFLENRLLWAMIMTALSMNKTAGQSTFQFALRIIGTTIAMIGAYVVWYIVDRKTPGAIVFLWLWIALAFYPIVKMPKFLIVAVLSLITTLLIIGYELQTREIGIKAATATGQPAYPTYILAPYRLATVTCGILVAFIWTIFPFPFSESTELRKDLAASLHLMSAYYENVHQTIQARVAGKAGSIEKKGTHAYNLEKARYAIFSKLIFILNTLTTNAAFSKFQLRVGGHFPLEEYNDLIGCMRRLLLWISLGSYASVDFDHPENTADPARQLWAAEFRKALGNTQPTGAHITSLLSTLSSSLSHGQPLPPYLEMPKSFEYVKKLEYINKDIVSIRHSAEPEYSSFAVLQICTQCINTDVRKLTKHVKNLVGEIDFSYHARTLQTSISSDDDDDDSDGKSKAD